MFGHQYICCNLGLFQSPMNIRKDHMMYNGNCNDVNMRYTDTHSICVDKPNGHFVVPQSCMWSFTMDIIWLLLWDIDYTSLITLYLIHVQ